MCAAAIWSASSQAARQKVAAEMHAAAGLSADLGRPVREPAARRRAALDRGADRDRADLPAAVHHIRFDPAGALVLCNVPFATIGGVIALCLPANTFRFRHRSASSRCSASPCSTAWSWSRISISCVLTAAAGRRHGGRQAPAAAGVDDREHHGARPDAVSVCQRPRLRDPAAAGDRGDRRAVSSTVLTLILLPILYRSFGGVAKEAK